MKFGLLSLAIILLNITNIFVVVKTTKTLQEKEIDNNTVFEYEINRDEFFEVELPIKLEVSKEYSILFQCEQDLPYWILYNSINNTLTGIYKEDHPFKICILIENSVASTLIFLVSDKAQEKVLQSSHTVFALTPIKEESYLSDQASYIDSYNVMKSVRLENDDVMVIWAHDSNPKKTLLMGAIISNNGEIIKTNFEIGETLAGFQVIAPSRSAHLPQFDIIALTGGQVLVISEEVNIKIQIIGRIFDSTGMLTKQFVLSSNDEFYNLQPKIHKMSSEDIGVSWVASAANKKAVSEKIYITILDKYGNMKYDTVLVVGNSYRTNTLEVVPRLDGNNFMIWQERFDIFAKIVGSNGFDTVKPASKLASQGSHYEVKSLALSNGNILVVGAYLTIKPDDGYVMATILDSNSGQEIKSVEVSPASRASKENLQIIALNNKNLLISWRQQGSKYRTWKEIHAAIISEDGTIIRSEFMIGTFDGVADIHTYQVALLKEGNVLFTWRDEGKTSDIIGKVIKEDGDTLIDEFFINDAAPILWHGNPLIQTFQNGNILAAWFTGTNDYRKIDSIAMKIWSSQIISNSIPIVNAAIPSNDGKEGKEYMVMLADDMFQDEEGDSLRISVRYDKECIEPNFWLKYYPGQNSLYGIPNENSPGQHNITIIARDPKGGFAKNSFLVTIHSDNAFAAKLLIFLILIFILALILPGALAWKRRVWVEREQQKKYLVFEGFDPRTQTSSKSENIPKDMVCGFTEEFMSEPWEIICTDGSRQSYEGELLFGWLKTHNYDPISKKKRREIKENTELKQRIEEYIFNLETGVYREDPVLLREVQIWIEKRGEDVLLESGKLKFIVERVKEAMTS